jgi:hypothetical protein
VARGRATGEPDPRDELRTDRDHHRRIEVVGEQHGRRPIGVEQRRPLPSRELVDDPPADVSQVRGALAEVLVVDRRERVGLGRRHPVDRLLGGRTLIDRDHRRIDDARVAREHRLGLEDRADLLAGTTRRLLGERRQLGGRGLERIREPHALRRRIGARGCARRQRPDRCRPACGCDPQSAPQPDTGRPRTPDDRRPRHVRGQAVAAAASELPAAAVSASTVSSSVADVAPGSWWPTLRSPR